MITRKEKYKVKVEIELEVLAGELQVMEADLQRMPLKQFLEVWGPEKRSGSFWIKVSDVGNVEEGVKYQRVYGGKRT